MAAKRTKDAVNVFALLVMVPMEALKKTLTGKTVHQKWID
jgi:hypothetical protein